MIHNDIDFPYTARYIQTAPLTKATKQLWFVLHGYGQLAPYFIRKFDVLHTPEHVVVAPEGISRFYLKGHDGRVGATWMTREERQSDINNYIKLLNAIYRSVMQEGTADASLQINIVGFSQGAATASRWAVMGELTYHRLILWAGVFPPDMPDTLNGLQEKDLLMVYGANDPYINEERLSAQTDFLDSAGLKYHVTAFDGVHDIDKETLKSLAETFLS